MLSNIEAIERRLAALEADLARQRRLVGRYRRAFTVAVLGAVALGVMAAGDDARVPRVIQANRFEVVNDDGKLVLALSAAALGGQADIWNVDGQNVMRLAAGANGGDLALWNKEGTNVVGAYATQNGGATSVWNNAGREVFSAAAETDGAGKIVLGNETGQTVAALDAIPDVGAALAILNERGENMFIAGTHKNGGAINIWNRDGVPILIAGIGGDEHSGAISIRNGRGNLVYNAGVDEEEGGRMTIWNADGRKPRNFSCIK